MTKLYFDFPFFLTMLVLISGLICLFDLLFWAKKRKKAGIKQPRHVEYARSFFPVLLLVWLIRSFVVQPYRVPSGSLEPTVLPGDFIVVNQFAYGLRFPIFGFKMVNIGEPKTGDIVLFHWPKNPSIIFVKRMIGLPGDHVVYRNKTLTINGKSMSQTALGMGLDQEGEYSIPASKRMEDLNGVPHAIFTRSGVNLDAVPVDLVVPPGNYFVMGDNRDGSDDSRDWGFVPEENLIGKAMAIWMSFDSQNFSVRWSRIGIKL